MSSVTRQSRPGIRPALVSDERGVILVQVALMLVVIIGFSALVIDHGVMLVARAQAQNAADAGALAAATTLAFDTMAIGDEPIVEQTAIAVASSMGVWGRAPAVEPWICYMVSADGNPSSVECPEILDFPPPPVRTDFGITVRVYRDGEESAPGVPIGGPNNVALPTYFARLFHVDEQGTKAQATAVVVPANTSTCVWPLAIPDLWASGDDTYDRLQYPGEPTVTIADVYSRPSVYVDGSLIESSPTGIAVTTNIRPSNSLQYGQIRLIDLATSTGGLWPRIENPTSALGGRPVAVRIPRSGSGGFVDNLTSCNQAPIHIGDVLPIETGAGVTLAEVANGAATLVARDGAASWNGTTYRPTGSCVASDPPCAVISPRLVVVPVFDPDVYDQTRGNPGGPRIEVVNFVGLFIEDGAGPVTGRLSTYPGLAEYGYPFVQLENSPLRTAVLTR